MRMAWKEERELKTEDAMSVFGDWPAGWWWWRASHGARDGDDGDGDGDGDNRDDDSGARMQRVRYIYPAPVRPISYLMHPPCPSHRRLRSPASAPPIPHLLSRSMSTPYALSPGKSQSLSTKTSCP